MMNHFVLTLSTIVDLFGSVPHTVMMNRTRGSGDAELTRCRDAVRPFPPE